MAVAKLNALLRNAAMRAVAALWDKIDSVVTDSPGFWEGVGWWVESCRRWSWTRPSGRS